MDAKDEKPGGDSSELSPSQGQTAIPVSSSEAENGTDPKSNAQDKFAAASASTSDTISIKTNSIRENQSADARPFNVLGKYLYNSNPFYAISAAFVLLGLHYVFHDEAAVLATTAVDFNSWLLLGVIAGYCAILAATALVIVRLGKVWDDARTILCTLLLVLVALSVNFDKLALTNPVTFIKVLSLGLVFAVGLVEFMLKSLGIRMSL